MQESASNPKRLNPRQLMDYIKQFVTNERTILNKVFIRHTIGAIFFALFNYRALKSYIKGKRGDSPYGDSFRLSTFFEDLLSKGFDYAIPSLPV